VTEYIDRSDEVAEWYAEDDVLGQLVDWFGTYVSVMDRSDLVLLSLWVIHTHLVSQLRTTPRLHLDSPLPESGKTTVLEHLQRLCHRPILMSTVSSGALLPRLLAKGPRTILIDECQRSLRPDRPGVDDVIATITSGYRVGASRPVLVPSKGGGWDEEEMSTFGPVAMAGISPRLPDDVISRIIRVLLMPDPDVEDTDWDVIEDAAKDLKSAVEAFAELIRDSVVVDVELPAGCRGRMKEKWRPLKRVAVAIGGDWPDKVDEMIVADIADRDATVAAGLRKLPPGVRLLLDLKEFWPSDEDNALVPSAELVALLIRGNADYWGAAGPYGKQLTETRLGHLMNQACKEKSIRPGGRGPRGFTRKQLLPAWNRLSSHLAQGLPQPGAPGEPGEPGAQHDAGLTDSTGCTGSKGTPTQPGAANEHALRPGVNGAYLQGLCRDCGVNPYSAGRPRCNECHHIYLTVIDGYNR
jgi:hypothetical protein